MIQTKYLNSKNPDVIMHYTGYRLRNGIQTYDRLTPEQLAEFENDFLARLPMFQRGREYLYPFFIDINCCPEANTAYRSFCLGLGRGYGCPPSDIERDEFERQFAAGKVAEYNGFLGNNTAVS